MGRATLTNTDRATLRTFVQNAADCADWRAAGDDGSIAAWLNTQEPTPTKAWNSSCNPQLIDEATDWSRFDNVVTVAAKQNAWLHRFFVYARDFSVNAIRKWVTDTWGTGTEAQAILTAALANATRAQAALGGTSKTTATIAGLDRTFVGQVQAGDVALMRGTGW